MTAGTVRPPTLFISAGEESGDLHGAALAEALRNRFPGVRLLGLGGGRMASAGVELLADLKELAVMGLVEVLRHLPFFIELRRRVWSALEAAAVDLVIPVDYPGFNLRLAARAKSLGIPVLYYIAPQVWAWHRSRIRQLARDTDAVAVVLPFEETFFRAGGVRARFVGHPLLDRPPRSQPRPEWMGAHGLDPARPLLGLFPGSRAQEVHRHLRLFSDAAARVVAARPRVQTAVAVPPGLDTAAYGATRWPLIRDARGLLSHATALLVKSGTTTLEAGVAGTPMVVAYRMNPVSFAVARRVVKVPHIALANLIPGERVAPEFVQEEASPKALAGALLPLLEEGSAERDAMLRALRTLPERLGGPGASRRVAELAAELLGRRGTRG